MGFLTPEVIAILTLGSGLASGGFIIGKHLENRLTSLEVTQGHILETLKEIKDAQK